MDAKGKIHCSSKTYHTVMAALPLPNSPSFITLLNPSRPPSLPPPPTSHLSHRYTPRTNSLSFTNKISTQQKISSSSRFVCNAIKKAQTIPSSQKDEDEKRNGVVKVILWTMEAVYILWLFLLPYAPGDPVWAISSDTINSLVGLSLNFFFVLPLMNSLGIHVLEAPVLHPMSEGLFNFVIGWTLMFAPLLFTDCKRNRYEGSLDVLWGFQMFLTNTFLIPYMAIRLNGSDSDYTPKEFSKLSTLMVSGAPIVGLIGGAACVISILWALYGRMDGDFGTVIDRWQFIISYLGSERLAYAFIWDIVLYTIFQPWLIGENLENVQVNKVGVVSKLRYIPVVGLVAYLLSLEPDNDS